MPLKSLPTATLVISALAASAATAETMIFATDLPPQHVISVNAAEPLMACITERTGGAIDFNYMPAGQLVKRGEMVDALNKGLAQMAMSALANEAAALPLQGMAMLPGMSTSALQGTVAYRKALDMNGAMRAELTKNNVHPVLLNLLAPYQIMGKEVLDDVSDWSGKKVRATGSALVPLVESIGSAVVQLPATELYVAMQQGTIDALILSFASVPPYSINEVTTHYSSNTSFGTTSTMFGMNLELYNSLPEDQRKAIDDCGREIEVKLATIIHEDEGKIRDRLASEGATVYELSDAQLAGFAEKIAPVSAAFVKRLADLGLDAQKAFDEMEAAIAETPAN